MGTKIHIKYPQNKINLEKLCIDSSKFLVDADIFDKIDFPKNLIIVDEDTGEKFDDFKQKTLRIAYNNHHYYIGNYVKILRGVVYNKVMIYFSAKLCKDYFKGIQFDDFKAILEHIRVKGYISYSDDNITSIINEFRLKDADITFNKVIEKSSVPDLMEQLKNVKEHCNEKEKIRIFNTSKNKGIQFGNRGCKYFFKIYDKSLEIESEISTLNLSTSELEILKKHEVFRFEMTIRNKKDFEQFNIDSKFVNVLWLLENSQETMFDLIKKYYEYYIASYTPKQRRKVGDLTPTETVMLSAWADKKRNGYNVLQMENIALSGFDSSIPKENISKVRQKKLFYKIMDVLYSNEDKINAKNKRAMRAYDFIHEIFFRNF